MGKNGIITANSIGESEMADLVCPECTRTGKRNEIRLECSGNVEVRGIIKCIVDDHEFPFSMRRNFLQQLDTKLPGAQSDSLNTLVPDDIIDDIKEAERANYAQCYKAAAAMCRRAIQLSLIEKQIADQGLGSMIEKAHKKNLLTTETYGIAKSLKLYGDIGVHRKEQLEPKRVELGIYIAVEMLNELFK